MDFIHDINFVTAFVGREIDTISQVTDILHTGVGGRINFYEVQITPLIDRDAGPALVAGPVRQRFFEAIDRLGQNSGGACLPRAARS